MKIKPSLAPPDQYVEMGLWRQVMQVNQQICQEMEQLDKKLEENDCQDNSEVHAYDCFCFLSCFFSCFFFSNTTLCIHCCMHFTQKKSRSKLKWIKQSVFHNCITRHNCERGMEESKSGLSVWQSSLSVWLSPSVVFLSAVKFVYLAFYSFCVSALICLSNCLLCLYINVWSVFLSTSLACLWVVYLFNAFFSNLVLF